MCTCVCVCVCVTVCLSVHVCVRKQERERMRERDTERKNECVRVCVRVCNVRACDCVCVRVFLRVHVYICACTHLYRREGASQQSVMLYLITNQCLSQQLCLSHLWYIRTCLAVYFPPLHCSMSIATDMLQHVCVRCIVKLVKRNLRCYTCNVILVGSSHCTTFRTPF